MTLGFLSNGLPDSLREVHRCAEAYSGMIVMYHYVRPRNYVRFPYLSALGPIGFRKQVAWLKERTHVVALSDLTLAVQGKCCPRVHLALTFDDGLKEHAAVVAPVLFDLGLPATFFISSKPVLERTMLDVQKSQFVLATRLGRKRFLEIGRHHYHAAEQDLKGRLDAAVAGSPIHRAEIVHAKRLLQRELPQLLRSQILNDLFDTYVTSDQASFAEATYMSLADATVLRQAGFSIGGHGHSHEWLSAVSPEVHDQEILMASEFVASKVGVTEESSFAYPYGRKSPRSMATLKRAGFSLGLRDSGGVLCRSCFEPYDLKRLDTFFLPYGRWRM